MQKLAIAIPVIALVAAVGLSSVYVVDEREQALVLQFGQVKEVKTTPGLGFKLPLIQTVKTYEDRILSLTTRPLEVTPLDDRRLVVDAFARWRITDAVKFHTATRGRGEPWAQQQLDNIITAQIREVLGGVPSTAVLSDDRISLMVKIRDSARAEAQALGVEVIDVRLTRTDLPDQNLEATYARMRAEREREAADEIARGNEAAQRIRASADRTRTELTSDAQRQAEIVRGEAQAQANKIYAEAYNKDPNFFAFTRQLDFYANTLKSDSSRIIAQPDSLYFDYDRFLKSLGEAPSQAQTAKPPAAQ
ncbi:protease modulator HflC [Thioclava sp. GXIMD4216]|uniref:protease modulator HflC n=1 Tax=Thioclava sp. GXIMD4216 TaxID=3131929 RepID=UPI0030CDF6E5